MNKTLQKNLKTIRQAATFHESEMLRLVSLCRTNLQDCSEKVL